MPAVTKVAVGCTADGLLSLAFTDLRGSQLASAPPLSGIFTTVCDASSLTADHQANRNSHSPSLQDMMAGSSALVLLLTRADNPARTEGSLQALLDSAPAALKVPLVLLTTAPDLDRGVQQWLQTLPGLPHHVRSYTAPLLRRLSPRSCHFVLKLAKHSPYSSHKYTPPVTNNKVIGLWVVTLVW